jgi:hypothetical protein
MIGWGRDNGADLYVSYGRVTAYDRSGTSHPYYPRLDDLTTMLSGPVSVTSSTLQATTPVINASSNTSASLPAASALKLWLQSDTGVVLDGQGRVTRWEDQSGSGNHASQADPAKQPRLTTGATTGLPVIQFSGGQNLEGALGQLDAPVTVFAAVRMADNSGPQYVLSLGDKNNAGGYGSGNHVSISREAGGYYSMWGYPAAEPGHLRKWGVLPSETPLVISVRYRAVDAPTNHALWVNSQGYGVPGYTLPSGQQFNNKGDFAIGRWLHPNYPWWLDADVTELLIYGAELSSADRAAVEQYLTGKLTVGSTTAGSDPTISLTCSTSGSTIHYTLDGSTPTSASTTYTGTFVLTQRGVTLKAICVKPGYEDSVVVSRAFN